jgi:putative ABC transport system permease protein
MASLALFHRLILRPMRREPVRTLLTLVAVALGVAVVLAIELAGQAAVGSFRASIETLAGDTELEVVAAGGVPEEIVARLATLPFPLEVSPRLEEQARTPSSYRAVTVLGLDLIAGSSGVDALASRQAEGSASTEPRDESLAQGSGWLSGAWVSEDLGLKIGDRFELLAASRLHVLEVRGTLPAGDTAPAVVALDIGEAQRVVGRGGRVDRILVSVPDTPSIEEWQTRIAGALPEGMQVRRRGAGTEENRKMLAAFRWNLRVLSYIALIVGAFLIYNTISVSVVRRRPEIGVVRALGATRGTILLAFLAEAASFGLAGGLLGLPLGRAMASGAVSLMSATVQSLYVSSSPGPIVLTPAVIVLALGAGLAVAVLSAISPAREAAAVTPSVAMARGERETLARVHRFRDLAGAVACAMGAAAASRAPAIGGKPLLGYLAALLLIGACALAIPALVHSLASASAGLLRHALGVEALLASRSLAGSLRRTSVLVGALATAIAMMVAVGIMVGSFRQTVISWLDAQLPADLYLSPGGAAGPEQHSPLPPGLADAVERVPGVAAVDRFRAYPISYKGLPATFSSTDTEVALRYRQPAFVSGRPPSEVLRQLQAPDTAIVSEPFANKHGVRAGDRLALPLGDRVARLRVLDVYYDYASERGYVMVDRQTLLRYLPEAEPSGLAVYVAPGQDVAAVRAAIERASPGYRIGVVTNRQLREQAVMIFDRTFAITYALEAVAIVVAVIGIAGAMLALVIDRRRELGLLRFLGAARGQVRRIILAEAGLLGLLANVAGLGLGTALSLVLVFVINKQSFGWTIRFHWPVGMLMTAITGVYAATVLAGLYPARVASRLDPIEVVHDE